MVREYMVKSVRVLCGRPQLFERFSKPNRWLVRSPFKAVPG